MALVLSRQTGLVSPQFHLKFDDRFQTIKDLKNESLWQTRAGFISKLTTKEKKLSTDIIHPPTSEGDGLLEAASLPPTEAFTFLEGAHHQAPEGAPSEGAASTDNNTENKRISSFRGR